MSTYAMQGLKPTIRSFSPYGQRFMTSAQKNTFAPNGAFTDDRPYGGPHLGWWKRRKLDVQGLPYPYTPTDYYADIRLSRGAWRNKLDSARNMFAAPYQQNITPEKPINTFAFGQTSPYNPTGAQQQTWWQRTKDSFAGRDYPYTHAQYLSDAAATRNAFGVNTAGALTTLGLAGLAAYIASQSEQYKQYKQQEAE